jgi:hypothetical protein
MATRDEVFKVIEEERMYQGRKWPRSEFLSTTGEITLIRSYLRKFDDAYQKENDDPNADVPLECLHIIRKMAAILVRNMEHHRIVRRVEPVSE